jgi:outer membrane lipoprotein-sorting protein
MHASTIVLTLLLAPASIGQAQDPAQKLYEAMEQKLTKAKAHKIGYEIDGLDGKRPVKFKGVLILATGNRVKMTLDGADGKRATNVVIVSDGKTGVRRVETDGKPATYSWRVHEQYSDFLVGYLSRTGLFAGIQLLHRDHPVDPAMWKLSGFKMIGNDKVGNREANGIEYQLNFADAKIVVTCKLWLDAQTNLPLKRILENNDAGKVEEWSTETYSQWELDPKLPDNIFMLPK